MVLSDTFARMLGRTRQAVLLGVGFVLLMAIVGSTVWLVDQASDNADLVAHTLKVQNAMSDILLNVRRAESSQRGYLFTNQQTYLPDFTAARPDVDSALRELHELTQDSPRRQAQVDRIRALIDAKFAEMQRTIDLNVQGNREQARATVLGGRGRSLMDDLRKIVDEATDEETRLLTERTEHSQQTSTLLLLVSIVGAALVALAGGLSVYLVQQNYRRAERARSEVQAVNENLEDIVQYRTADLREANEEIQRFAYIVSHDLRSPLVNIMGFTTELEALRKDLFERVEELNRQMTALNAQAAEAQGEPPNRKPLDELGSEFDEALGFVKTSISKMDRLINAVLKLSREGRREFRPETIDMDALAESIARTVAHRAMEAGTTITVDKLPSVESDRLALEQIFSNLADNALKYLRADEPGRIHISGRSSGVQVIYDVTDNGRGIDERDHQRVFELFRRSGPQDRPGEGIGLAHVRALVRRLGGHMGLKSELGKGSTFTVTLPRRWSVQSRNVA